MKARFSPQTAKSALNSAQRQAVITFTDQIWARRQRIASRRFYLAMCLALNDIYGFGDKRLGNIIRGVADILNAYATDNFSASEARNGCLENGDEDPMAEAMQAELSSRRKIHIKIEE